MLGIDAPHFRASASNSPMSLDISRVGNCAGYSPAFAMASLRLWCSDTRMRLESASMRMSRSTPDWMP